MAITILSEKRKRKRGPHSAEARAKISKALRGKNLTVEHRAAISEAVRRKFSGAETRAKLSQAHRGKSTGPRSAETRAKISQAVRRKLNSAETRAKLSKAHRGKSRLSPSARVLEGRINSWPLGSLKEEPARALVFLDKGRSFRPLNRSFASQVYRSLALDAAER